MCLHPDTWKKTPTTTTQKPDGAMLGIVNSGWRHLHQHFLSNEQKNCLLLTASAEFLASVLQGLRVEIARHSICACHCAYSAQKNTLFNPIWKWIKRSSTKALFVTCEGVTQASREQLTHLTTYFHFTAVTNINFIGWSVLRFSQLCSHLSIPAASVLTQPCSYNLPTHRALIYFFF